MPSHDASNTPSETDTVPEAVGEVLMYATEKLRELRQCEHARQRTTQWCGILHRDYESTCRELVSLGLRTDEGVAHETR